MGVRTSNLDPTWTWTRKSLHEQPKTNIPFRASYSDFLVPKPPKVGKIMAQYL